MSATLARIGRTAPIAADHSFVERPLRGADLHGDLFPRDRAAPAQPGKVFREMIVSAHRTFRTSVGLDQAPSTPHRPAQPVLAHFPWCGVDLGETRGCRIVDGW
jgi:hypothetical protein